MSKQVVAVVGLGRVGSAFLEELMCVVDKGIKVAYAVEQNDTPGRRMAETYHVQIVTLDGLIAEGEKVDVIFDLTGSADVRRELREKLHASGNRHSVIAPESVARMVWTLMADDKVLPDAHDKKGY